MHKVQHTCFLVLSRSCLCPSPPAPGCLSWELTVQAWEFGGLGTNASLPPSKSVFMAVVVSLYIVLETTHRRSYQTYFTEQLEEVNVTKRLKYSRWELGPVCVTEVSFLA